VVWVSTAQEQISYEVRDGVARVTIRRPEAKNALTKAMYAQIRDSLRRAWLDDSVFALVLAGSEGAFAVGGDLKEMLAQLESDDHSQLLAYDEVLPFETLRSIPKPTIAVVDGICMGGGLTMMLLCDIAIATATSSFSIPEAKVGIVDGHMPRLLRDRVPSAILRYWLYTGARFSPVEAYAAGLLTKVVESDQLEATTEKMLSQLRESSANAISIYKHTLNETRTLPSMQDAITTMLGDDARQRLMAFGLASKHQASA
jgi:enoyl-CoA hydratase/carnithine racemase